MFGGSEASKKERSCCSAMRVAAGTPGTTRSPAPRGAEKVTVRLATPASSPSSSRQGVTTTSHSPRDARNASVNRDPSCEYE